MCGCVVGNLRCLERSLVLPQNNPVFCQRQNPLNHTFVMECCKDVDMCNVYLMPKLIPKPQGRKNQTCCSQTKQNPLLLLITTTSHGTIKSITNIMQFLTTPVYIFIYIVFHLYYIQYSTSAHTHICTVQLFYLHALYFSRNFLPLPVLL